MSRVLFFVYGLTAYGAFFATILYMIGFVGDFAVPKGINDGATGSVAAAILINVGLVLAFAVQHTIMARPAFKRWWTAHCVPKPVERSTFVLAASLVLAATFWFWRPLPATLWHIDSALGRAVLYGLFALGWARACVRKIGFHRSRIFLCREM